MKHIFCKVASNITALILIKLSSETIFFLIKKITNNKYNDQYYFIYYNTEICSMYNICTTQKETAL